MVAALRRHQAFWWLILPVAILSGVLYHRLIDLNAVQERIALHQAICNGTAESPYRYRVLVPYLCEVGIQRLNRWMPYESAFKVTYLVYDVVALVFSFSLLYYWLQYWHPRWLATLGTLFACASAPVAYWHHYFQPWSLLEPAFFTMGLILILTRRHVALVFLVVLYTLLRETAIALVFAYGLACIAHSEGGTKRDAIGWTAVYGVFWGLTYIKLRLSLGHAPHVESIAEIAATNLSLNNLLKTLLYLFLMFGGFLMWAWRGFSLAPLPLRRLSYGGVPYAALMAVWAIWSEVRCFLPLYSILIPLGLYAVRTWLPTPAVNETAPKDDD